MWDSDGTDTSNNMGILTNDTHQVSMICQHYNFNTHWVFFEFYKWSLEEFLFKSTTNSHLKEPYVTPIIINHHPTNRILILRKKSQHYSTLGCCTLGAKTFASKQNMTSMIHYQKQLEPKDGKSSLIVITIGLGWGIGIHTRSINALKQNKTKKIIHPSTSN